MELRSRRTPHGQDGALLGRRLGVLLLAAPLVLLWLRPDMGAVLRDPAVMDFVHSSNAVLWLEGAGGPVELEGEWRAAGGGISPVAGTSAAVVLRADAGPWDAGSVRPWGDPGLRWTVSISARSLVDGTISTQTLFQVPPGEGVDLDDERSPLAGEVVVRLRPADPEAAAEAEPALRKLDARLEARALDPQPPLHDFVALALAPFLVGAFLRIVFRLSEARALSGGAGVGPLLGAIQHSGEAPAGALWALVVGVGAAGALQALAGSKGLLPRRGAEPPDPVEWRRAGMALLAGVVVLAAFGARWEAFLDARRLPLSNDAIGYLAIARAGGGLYETIQHSLMPDIREPLLPWVLRGWLAMVPDAAASARFLGLLLGVLMAGMVFAAGARVVGGAASAAAAAVLAFAPEWAGESTRVLRLDLSVALLAGLVLLRGWRPSGRRGGMAAAAALAAVGSALSLLRLSYLALAVPVLVWEGLRRRWGWRTALLAAAVLVVPIVPHLAFNAREGGDWLYSANIHTRYYMNRDAVGTPGGMSAAEFAVDPYRGGPAGALGWMARSHGVVELAALHIEGAWRVFYWTSVRERLFGGRDWLLLPGVLGLWVLARRRDLWWLGGWFVLATLPAWLVAAKGADWRIGAEGAVLALWIWGLGLREGVVLGGGWLRGQVRRRLAADRT